MLRLQPLRLFTPPIPSHGRAVVIVQSNENGAAEAFRVSSPQSQMRSLNIDTSSSLEETVIVECEGGFTVLIDRKLLVNKSSLFTRHLLHCKRRTASCVRVLQIDLPHRSIKRYALWLCDSSDYATFDPSLTASERFLELSNLHIAAGILQDERFGNDVTDAMISHLVGCSHKMVLEDFLVEFLQTNAKGSTGRKLIADWTAWSNDVASDAKSKSLLQQIQDADFCYAVAKAVWRKTFKEWDGDLVPPYMVSPCFYHTHSDVTRPSCCVRKKFGA
jgi:hypothetical protein